MLYVKYDKHTRKENDNIFNDAITEEICQNYLSMLFLQYVSTITLRLW